MIDKIVLVSLVTLSPITELRGGIPLGLFLGLDPLLLSIITIFLNTVIFLPIYFLLEFFYYNFLTKFPIFRKYIEKIRSKCKKIVERYGYLGLAIFIGIPLPFTGVYTGTIASWLLGLNWKKTFLSVFFGVLIAYTIVFASCFGILKIV